MSLPPERREALRRKVLAAARAVVTYQVGLPHGATRLSGLLWQAADQQVAVCSRPHTVFRDFKWAIAHLPHGTNRLYWSTAKLAYLDIELEARCAEYRERIFIACYEIIEELTESRSPED